MTLNTPRAMLERLAFGARTARHLDGLTGLGAIFAARRTRAPSLVSGLLHVPPPLGYKHLHFREWEDSFEPAEGANAFELDPVLGKRAQTFAEMLASLETLQQRIAAGEGDVWAVQRLRHDASAMLAAEPALREVFAAELAGHPELA